MWSGWLRTCNNKASIASVAGLQPSPLNKSVDKAPFSVSKSGTLQMCYVTIDGPQQNSKASLSRYIGQQMSLFCGIGNY